jgi:hypothetical protein
VATALRGALAPPALLLFATVSVALVTFVMLVRLSPRLALGEDGMWALCRIAERVPARFMLVARWKKSLERALIAG